MILQKTKAMQTWFKSTLWRKDKWVLEPSCFSTLSMWASLKPEVTGARGHAPSAWVLQRRRVSCSCFSLVSFLGLPVLGFKALSRTPVVIALVVLILSVVVLVAITLIQIHQKEVLLPGLKVSVMGSARKGSNGL